jgi:hypothetical protein
LGSAAINTAGLLTPVTADAGIWIVTLVEPVPVVCARQTRAMRVTPEIVDTVAAPPLSPHITNV